MNYRFAELLDAETISGATTKTIDLDYQKMLSRIDIRLHRTKTLGGMTAAGPSDITKIEIVDGADALVSLNGYEAQALMIYDRKMPSATYGQMLSGSSQVDFFGIDFGRKLWDRALAFDASRFVNPQLKISYDVNNSDSGVTSATLEVYGSFFEDRAITPVGMLAPIEHFTNTLGADNTWENVELPTDRAIRRMLVRLYYSGYEPWYVADELRLTEDSGNRDVFYWDSEVLYRLMHTLYPPVEQFFVGTASAAGDTYYVTPSDYWGLPLITNQSALTVIAPDGAAAARGGTITLKGASDYQCVGVFKGYLPWHTYDFPLGDLDDIDDWYDPSGKGKVEMRIKSHTAGTSGTGSVVLQKLRRY